MRRSGDGKVWAWVAADTHVLDGFCTTGTCCLRGNDVLFLERHILLMLRIPATGGLQHQHRMRAERGMCAIWQKAACPHAD